MAKRAKKTIGRPRMSDKDREARRQTKNERQRARRAEIKKVREAAIAKMTRSGVVKRKRPLGGAAAAFAPTDEDRARVQTLAGLGMRQDEIAIMVTNPKTGDPVDVKTLVHHFAKELREGPLLANSKVGESLYKQATGTGGVPRSTTAGIFWAKARMGWRETQHVEIDIKSGVLVAPGAVSPEDWVADANRADEGKQEPGGES